MIKEADRKIFLILALIAFILALVFRLIYTSFLMIQHFEFYKHILYGVFLFIIPLMLFFITFSRQKNLKIDLLILICIIEFADFLLRIFTRTFILITFLEDFFYIVVIILSILLLLKIVRTKKHVNTLKIVIIVSLCIYYFKIMFDVVFISNDMTNLLSISYFFTLITMGLLVITFEPMSVNIVNSRKSFYISVVYNILLLLSFNTFFFGNVLYKLGSTVNLQLVFILIILAVQGILSFYNKIIASHIFALFSNLLLLIYSIIISVNGMPIHGPIIVLLIGVITYIVLIVLDYKENRKNVYVQRLD